MNSIMNHAVNYGGRRVSKGPSFVPPLRPAFVRDLVTELVALHEEIPATKRIIVLFEFHPNKEVAKVPRSAMAFANRGTHQNAMIGLIWSDPKDDKRCKEWLAYMDRRFRDELNRNGAVNEKLTEAQVIGEYSNYDGMCP
ncbi:hypothetical protein B0O99DRAFT_689580 [Bisporella sp. PMI_857]|nr:hypothetical protein B0O99DRAFT_689580 [Bisporella sp. PMI_857]